jgi:hypothetical protein
VVDADGHVDPGRTGMPGGVRQRLAQRGDGLLGDLATGLGGEPGA